eukprot:134749_1
MTEKSESVEYSEYNNSIDKENIYDKSTSINDKNSINHAKLKLGDRVELSRGKTGVVKYIGKASDMTTNINVPGGQSMTDNEDVFGIELDKWSIYGNDGKNVFETSKGKGYFARRSSITNIILADNLLNEPIQNENKANNTPQTQNKLNKDNDKTNIKFYKQEWNVQKNRVNILIDKLEKMGNTSSISEQCIIEYNNLIQFVDILFHKQLEYNHQISYENKQNKTINVSEEDESDQKVYALKGIEIKEIEEKYKEKENILKLKTHTIQTRNSELQKRNIEIQNNNVELEKQILQLTDQVKSLMDSKYKLIRSTSAEIDNLRQKIKSSSDRDWNNVK